MTAAQYGASMRQNHTRRRDLERPIHEGVVKLACLFFPGAVIHHSPNENNMAGDRKARAIAIAKAKAMGMLKGFPDLLILWEGNIMAVEVKAPGNIPTHEQVQCGESIVRNGGMWACVYDVNQAEKLFAKWKAAIYLERVNGGAG